MTLTLNRPAVILCVIAILSGYLLALVGEVRLRRVVNEHAAFKAGVEAGIDSVVLKGEQTLASLTRASDAIDKYLAARQAEAIANGVPWWTHLMMKPCVCPDGDAI